MNRPVSRWPPQSWDLVPPRADKLRYPESLNNVDHYRQHSSPALSHALRSRLVVDRPPSRIAVPGASAGTGSGTCSAD